MFKEPRAQKSAAFVWENVEKERKDQCNQLFSQFGDKMSFSYDISEIHEKTFDFDVLTLTFALLYLFIFFMSQN